VFNFTLQSLYPRSKNPHYPLNGKVVGPWSALDIMFHKMCQLPDHLRNCLFIKTDSSARQDKAWELYSVHLNVWYSGNQKNGCSCFSILVSW
jgi:hypothetical protein